MTSPRNETLNRLTDIVADKVFRRLGTSGTGLADDWADRIEAALGFLLEVTPQTTPSTLLSIGAAVYTRPDGTRSALLKDSTIPALAAGTINFATGAISTGTVSTFAASLPNMTAGNYVRALIQYNPGLNAVNVSFGTQNAVLAATGVPSILDNYIPLCVVELHSTTGGIGFFDAIAATALVYIQEGALSTRGPEIEHQTVAIPTQTVFTLASVTIPQNRDRLRVEINGQRYYRTADFTVDSDTQVTFLEGVPENAVVSFEVLD